MHCQRVDFVSRSQYMFYMWQFYDDGHVWAKIKHGGLVWINIIRYDSNRCLWELSNYTLIGVRSACRSSGRGGGCLWLITTSMSWYNYRGERTIHLYVVDSGILLNSDTDIFMESTISLFPSLCSSIFPAPPRWSLCNLAGPEPYLTLSYLLKAVSHQWNELQTEGLLARAGPRRRPIQTWTYNRKIIENYCILTESLFFNQTRLYGTVKSSHVTLLSQSNLHIRASVGDTQRRGEMSHINVISHCML